MAIEQVDATQGAGEALYLGFAKVNQIITKINAIEEGAAQDQSGAEIKALLEALVDKLSIAAVKETDTKKIMTATERANIAANAADIVVNAANILKRELGWALLADAYVATGLGYFLVGPNLAGSTISKVKIYAKTAPTGASLIVDVNKNGTTIFTEQGKRPEIAISGNADDSDTPDITSLSEGDRLSFDIDQIGSIIAGGDPVLVTVIFA